MALTDNIVAYWKLDESSGNAADSAGTYTATNQGSVTYTTGKINNGATFGTNKYFSTSLTAIQTGNFTVSLWAKYAGTGDQIHFGSSTSNRGGIRLADPSGNIALYVNGSRRTYVSHTVSTGTWYHYVLTRNNDDYKLYWDGNSTPILTNTTSGAFHSGNFEISGAINGVAAFGGMLDEVGVWTRALSTAEISSLYNSGNALQYPFSSTSNIKSINGLAKSSIKSINGLAIASVKSWNGLS